MALKPAGLPEYFETINLECYTLKKLNGKMPAIS
jgi:hypothetical protein